MTTETVLGITNLRLKYPGEDLLIFKGLSLSIKRSEKVLLLGPSGCGKSTLLQVLCGIIPSSIELPMKADDIVQPERWGYVFQDPDSQFCMPFVDEELAFVLENMMVPREKMPSLIRRYLDLVGLQLDDMHTPIQQISQGMKQRLAIASVLALEPDVLFLDEPTALLDPEGTAQVWETIRRTTADKTLLIVEHKIDGILDFIDRVVVFTPDGEILADGNPEEVFTAYRGALTEYGIWHPGVWDAAAPPPREQPASAELSGGRQPLLTIGDFQGFRAGDCKIAVEREEVLPGDWIGIIGKNGAGKSSLLLAVMRLIRTSGDCAVKGVRKNKAEEIAEKAAFVFQNPEFQFVTDTVQDDLVYSLENPDESTVEEMLSSYDLLPLRHRHPYQLSMGQKRRLSVASALVKGQRLLLLDEPTFGLDARNTMLLLDKLERLRAGGAAILMITHDPEIVKRYCTRVWRITDGRIAESEAVLWS